MVRFYATTCSWNVRNLGQITTITDLNACFEVIGLGLLTTLNSNPTCWPVLALLFDYASHIRKSVGVVGGDFVKYATGMCDSLIAHIITGRHLPLLVPPLEMMMKTQKFRQDLAMFRSSYLSINSGSDMYTTATFGPSDNVEKECKANF